MGVYNRMAEQWQAQTDKYLDLKSLAEHTSLSVRTLREYLTDDEDPIPSYKLRRKILVKQSEFDGWMKRRQTDVTRMDAIVEEVVNEFYKH